MADSSESSEAARLEWIASREQFMRGATSQRAEQNKEFTDYRKDKEKSIMVLGNAYLELTFTANLDKKKTDSVLMQVKGLRHISSEMKHMTDAFIQETSLNTTRCQLIKSDLATMVQDVHTDFIKKLEAETKLETEKKERYVSDMAHYQHQIRMASPMRDKVEMMKKRRIDDQERRRLQRPRLDDSEPETN